MPPQPEATHYVVLGVATDAAAAEIRVAYRERAKRAHPDAGGDPAAFRRLIEAYETLNDPTRRRAYDDRMGIRRPSVHDGGTAAGGWSGSGGDFSGDVEFPAYLRDITDRPWEPGIGAPTDEPATPRVDPGAAALPADVVWWWPEQAVVPPVVAGPVLLATGRTTIAALAALTGHEAWRADLDSMVRNPPAVLGDTVVVWTDDGHLRAIDLGRGTPRWRVELGAASAGGIVAVDGVLVAARQDGRLVGIDPGTGRASWVSKLAGVPTVPLATTAGMVVAVAGGRSIEAVDVRKGRHRWRIALRQSLGLPPVVVGETVWLAGGGRAGALVRLDLATGAVRGSIDAGQAVAGLATDGFELFATVAGPSRLLAFDEHARSRLEVDLPNVCPEPALDDRFAYLGDPTARVITIDRGASSVVGVASLPFEPVGAPTLVADRLVFVARDGRLWATATASG